MFALNGFDATSSRPMDHSQSLSLGFFELLPSSTTTTMIKPFLPSRPSAKPMFLRSLNNIFGGSQSATKVHHQQWPGGQTPQGYHRQVRANYGQEPSPPETSLFGFRCILSLIYIRSAEGSTPPQGFCRKSAPMQPEILRLPILALPSFKSINK